MPTNIDGLAFGNQSSSPITGSILTGWIRRVSYWPRALTTVELRSVTTL
jgi:hypothetical protein